MKLTPDQIEELYRFTRKHYVEHYDLQTELVDHLANGIEEQWKENPSLTFEEARNREFKKFGVFGFMDVVAERQKAMGRRYWRIILKFYKEWFTLPKIMFTLLCSLLFFVVLNQIPISSQRFFVLIILFAAIVPMLFYSFKRRRILKNKDKKWQLEEMLLSHNTVFPIFMLPVHFWYVHFEISSYLGLFLISFFIVTFFIMAYIITYSIPSKAEALLAETYPEYKIS